MKKTNKRRKFNKTHLIILLIILIAIIAGASSAAIILNNKTRETSGDEIIPDNTNVIDENIISENVIENNVVEENKVEEEKETETNKTPVVSETKYYIKVNNQANVVTIYTKDKNGNFTVPVKAMVCSTGTATPKSGQYKIPNEKNRWGTLFGHTPGTYVYGQYTTKITGYILFHSVPYTKNGDPSSLEYWEYNKLGTFASAGCIRLTVQDAQWIYNNIPAGTVVEFYYDANPGPLGKPGFKNITDAYPENIRGWDPTDPDKNNPWKTYKEPAKEPVKNETTNNTTNSNETNTTNTNIENKVNNITNENVNNNTNSNNTTENSSVQDVTSNELI